MYFKQSEFGLVKKLFPTVTNRNIFVGLEVSHIKLEHNRSIHDVQLVLTDSQHDITSFVQVVVLATINVPADKAIVTFSWVASLVVVSHGLCLYMYMYM